jgi:hypothetical protein
MGQRDFENLHVLQTSHLGLNEEQATSMQRADNLTRNSQSNARREIVVDEEMARLLRLLLRNRRVPMNLARPNPAPQNDILLPPPVKYSRLKQLETNPRENK